MSNFYCYRHCTALSHMICLAIWFIAPARIQCINCKSNIWFGHIKHDHIQILQLILCNLASANRIQCRIYAHKLRLFMGIFMKSPTAFYFWIKCVLYRLTFPRMHADESNSSFKPFAIRIGKREWINREKKNAPINLNENKNVDKYNKKLETIPVNFHP